jgi:hypothetical protein
LSPQHLQLGLVHRTAPSPELPVAMGPEGRRILPYARRTQPNSCLLSLSPYFNVAFKARRIRSSERSASPSTALIRLTGFLGLVTQGDQGRNRVPGRIRSREAAAATCWPPATPAVNAGRATDAIAHLDHQPLGRLAPDAWQAYQGGGIPVHHAAGRSPSALMPERMARAILAPTPLTRIRLRNKARSDLAGETVEHVGILAHMQMGVQGDLGTGLRQVVEGGQGRLDLVTHALHLQQQEWGMVCSPAHRADARSSPSPPHGCPGC